LKEFNKALSNFINDAAVGGAIRHLADLGYSISQISDSLDYPLPKDKIASIIWEHFLNIGKISLKEDVTGPGTYEAVIKVHPEITSTIKVEVVKG